ncbi:hypothetical protein [Arthrobacter sp.]|uniref:hypothetical protein n=1 Tax=Arthrobacter sp. TaxID=1667 RepID=UPI003A8FCE8E
MKGSIVAAPFLLCALALAGCSASAQATASTPQTPVVAPQSAAAAANPGPGVDAEAVKASAVAAGRPAAAFDIQCQVWEQPAPQTPAEKWAQAIGSDWLAADHADCPDQITLPGYFAESFQRGATGELVVIVEDAPGAVAALSELARDVMDHTAPTNADLQQVTAKISGHQATGSYTRGQWDIGLPWDERAENAATQHRHASTATGQDWADEKMDQWLTKIRADSVADLALGFRLIDAWSSPQRGELVVTMDASLPQSEVAHTPYWSINQELEGTAVTILDNIYFDAPELERVTVKLAGSAHTKTVTRTDKWFHD